MSQHRSLKGASTITAKRNVLKRFERVELLKKRGFALLHVNATVIIEQVSENELRIRKARVIPEDEIRFTEETPIVLSDQARQQFLKALDHPPKQNAALRRVMAGKAKKSPPTEGPQWCPARSASTATRPPKRKRSTYSHGFPFANPPR